MSQANVDRFLEATAAFNRFGATPSEDDGGFLLFMDPEVRIEPQQATLQGTFVGLDGVRAWLADLAEHYDDGRIEYVDVGDLGDRAAGSRSRCPRRWWPATATGS